jgi:hypothetical protein
MTPGENTAVQPRNAAIEHLGVLIGTWQVSAVGAAMENETEGHVSFEWLEGGVFVLQRSRPPEPMPGGCAVIGCDDSAGRCAMQYFDARGVARNYEMCLGDGKRKQWREAPGFSQRFTGTFSDDHNTVDGAWELSRDSTTWEKDFDLIYRRVP